MEYKCSDVSGRLNTNKNRNAKTFPYFPGPGEVAYKIEIPLKIPLPPEFTQEPVTLGDHLRRRRLELRLRQKDVATRLNVTVSTIWNWEHGWSVDLRYLPRVIAFLGYNPIPRHEDLLDRLAWYKQANGLTLEQLGAEMGRDPEQVGEWLSGRHQPCRRNREEVERFLICQISRLSI